MPFKKAYTRSKKYAGKKTTKKTTTKAKSKSKLTPIQRKEVKKLIYSEQENKYILTGGSDDNSTNAPYSLAFQSYAVTGTLPCVPIIQSIQSASYMSCDEQIFKGLDSGQRVGAVIRVIKLLLNYTISIPIQFNTVYGFRYKVKAVIYRNKDSNDPSQQIGNGLNGYNIFKNGLSLTTNSNLCLPSSTISDFISVLDPSIYKVCYSEIFELTPPSFKDANGDLENVSLSPVGVSRTVNLTRFIKKKLIYDNLKAGSSQESCTNDNLYMTFFTCDDTGSKLDSSAKFNVVWNHQLTFEDA